MPAKDDADPRANATAPAASNPASKPDVGDPTSPTAKSVDVRRGRYMIALRTVPGFMPMSADSLHSTLESIEGVEVVRRVKPRSFGVMSVSGAHSAPEIIVAKMHPEKGEMLRAQAKADPRYIVEHDAELIHASEPQHTFLPQFAPPTAKVLEVNVQVLGDDRPLAKAMVQVYGPGLPSQGITDEAGHAQISVFGETIRAIYVKPAANFWEKMIIGPSLDLNGTNVIKLRPLTETYPDFPDKGVMGWGQKEMQLDRINPGLTGRGVKVGIIDSGCDASHPQLAHVHNGVDFTNNADAHSWRTDTMSHGTHCAGIIGAGGDEARGIRGFAPGAEIHAFKVFPGGRSSDLIDALDQCIDLGIDVVNMSLGTDTPSELVAQKILEATNKGVACIVAAGNSGGAVQFPGSVPSVFTVSAVGKLNVFPADSAHAMTKLPGGVGDMFPAKFSCFGPKIDVSAPGVAILSCVPGGYAAWDGTSMATPHVTGLAALVLAHHPAFQGKPKQANIQRVQQLFEILKRASTPVVADVTRGGAGLPNTIGAVGQIAPVASPPTPVDARYGAPPNGGAAAGYGGGAVSLSPEQQQQLLIAAVANNPMLYQAVMQLRAVGLM